MLPARAWSLVVGGSLVSFAAACGEPPYALVLSADGKTVYDNLQGVTWLADANLAGDATVRAAMGVQGINPNGTMNYTTALSWVDALNKAGYLGRDDWQLPTTPSKDNTCATTGRNENGFGPSCKGSALGRLYSDGFHRTYPAGIVPATNHEVGPLDHLQQGQYWTSGARPRDPTPPGSDSAHTYTFSNDERGQKTTAGNFLYVLPKVDGVIGTTAPTGTGLVPYTSGAAAGLAVYDTEAKVSWAIDGALAAWMRFTVVGTASVTFDPTGTTLPAPLIDDTGKMRFSTAHDWIAAMNNFGFAGSQKWELPAATEMAALYTALELEDTNYPQLLEGAQAGPFRNLQVFFYWSCHIVSGDSRSPCDDTKGPGDAPGGDPEMKMRWAFNFQSGFQGTDKEDKEYFVMVYAPGP
jgi:Protein of unknown function (DUF1566)